MIENGNDNKSVVATYGWICEMKAKSLTNTGEYHDVLAGLCDRMASQKGAVEEIASVVETASLVSQK